MSAPRSLLILLTCTSLLGACALTDILKDPNVNYNLAGEPADTDTEAYLQEILEGRVSEKQGSLFSRKTLDAQAEEYLEQSIRTDLLKALYSRGYYNAKVEFENSAQPMNGRYIVDPETRFTISSINISPAQYASHQDDLPIAAGQPLAADPVLAAQSVLYNAIQKDRCYFSLDVQNQVFLNRGAHTGDIDFLVAAGREGSFGPLQFSGNTSVKESYLRKLVPWKEGKCFRREQLEAYKTSLLQSGLFARADEILPEAPLEDGQVPVRIDLKERAHRSISAGATYYSDEGLGAILGWEHRNFFGAAENLKAALKVSMLEQSLNLDFNKPYFMRLDQNLSFNTALRHENTDAYDETGVDAGAALSRNFTKRLSASTGVKFSLLRIDDNSDNTSSTYGLVSLPQSITFDNRDDKLDPHKGWNLNAALQPFFDALGESDPFFKTSISGSGYLSLGTGADIVLASKLGLGNIWGSDTVNVPATERFYAGGGGTVRGFGYQEVGPQKDGQPSGGRSLANFSIELRSKFTDKIGGVAFVDGASVSEESTPEFDNIAIGAGIGLRYYTSFGPVRFDIATPLTQKEDLDQNYQFYISIGQAF